MSKHTYAIKDMFEPIEKYCRKNFETAIIADSLHPSRILHKNKRSSQMNFYASPLFVLQVKGVKAVAREIGNSLCEKFIVFKDSKARKDFTPSLSQSKKNLRKKLIQDGKLLLSEQCNCLVFAEDVEFNSPSEAASIIAGNPRSGPQMWKDADTGKSYKVWAKEKPRKCALVLKVTKTYIPKQKIVAYHK